MIYEQISPDTLPCGILVTDTHATIRFGNRWIIDTTGISDTDLARHTVSDILSESERVLNSDKPFQCHLVCKDSTRMPVIVCARPVLSTNATNVCIVIMPIPYGNTAGTAVSEALERDHFFRLAGKSSQMQELYSFIEMAASTDSNVVIQGESGSGKELVASAIHQASARKDKPFVRVNCAALTETLLESELFGHVRGAFTGAYKDHPGTFEFADKGTLFLDEIGEISPAMQAKLLRVLQERIIVRVGDNREISVDVRIVAATNRNLRQLVTKGKFREDLFYRLNVFPIHLPPLRERKTDLPLLIDHFIDKFCKRTGKHIQSCSTETMRILMAYCWPGNVRELENTIEHAFVLCRGNEIQIVDLPHELRVAAVREGICAEKTAGVEQTIHAAPVHLHKESSRIIISSAMIEEQLARHNGNKTAAARSLGISKVGLWKKMKKLGME